MKNLLLIVLLVVGSCEEKTAKVFTSMEDEWVISGEVSGRFTLAKVGTDLVVDHGYYEYDGIRYEISIKQKLEQNANYQVTVFLLADADNALVLRYCDQDLINFKTLTPASCDLYIDGAFYKSYSDLKVTRP